MSELIKVLGEYLVPLFGLLTLTTLFVQGLRKLAREYRSLRKELAQPHSPALLPPASSQSSSKPKLESAGP